MVTSLKYLLPTSHLFHLAFRHATTIIDDSCGLEARGLVELNEQLSHHVGQVLDHFLAEELLLQRQKHLELRPMASF